MLFRHDARPASRRALGVVLAAILAMVALAAAAARESQKPVAAPVAQTPEVATPEVGDTPTNLRAAFTEAMNAKTRYDAAAKQADRDGYPYVAQLFRACSRAERVHADQHVHAIAWTGGEARALLGRLALGTTQENLQTAISLETYEANELYPAFLERARADNQPAAVRSLTFALAANREHARLLSAALETFDQRLPVRTLYVCPLCGKTTEALSFDKCPNCYTAAKKFERVS